MSAREVLAAMRARCEAATPWPWESDGGFTVDSARGLFVCFKPESVPPERCADDFAFIAAARTDVPKLLAVAEAAAAFIEQRDRYNGETEETETASLWREAEKLCCLREALAALGAP